NVGQVFVGAGEVEGRVPHSHQSEPMELVEPSRRNATQLAERLVQGAGRRTGWRGNHSSNSHPAKSAIIQPVRQPARLVHDGQALLRIGWPPRPARLEA